MRRLPAFVPAFVPALVPALLLVPVLLAGCGDDDGGRGGAGSGASDRSSGTPGPTGAPSSSAPSSTGTATDQPTKSPPLTPSTGPAPDPEHTVVALESATNAGGTVDLAATPVGPGESGGTTDLLGQLSDAGFRELLEQRITASRAEGDLYAAVVAVGCDVPPGVSVTEDAGVVTITPEKVAKPLPNCFAPVTTVAVVAVG